MSQLFAWGGQSTRGSALASFPPKKSQGWSPSEWTGYLTINYPFVSSEYSKPTVIQCCLSLSALAYQPLPWEPWSILEFSLSCDASSFSLPGRSRWGVSEAGVHRLHSLCFPLGFQFSVLLSYCQNPRKQLKHTISLNKWVFTVNDGQRILWPKH